MSWELFIALRVQKTDRNTCCQIGVNISKEDVRKTLKKIDSDRVTIRRKKIIRRRMYQTTYLVTFTV